MSIQGPHEEPDEPWPLWAKIFGAMLLIALAFIIAPGPEERCSCCVNEGCIHETHETRTASRGGRQSPMARRCQADAAYTSEAQ